MTYGFNNKKEKVDLLDFFYPVGTIYETADADFNPNTNWGGTWTKVEGKMLIGANSTYKIGTTGGAASQQYTPAGTVGNHKLTINEIPSHTHSTLINKQGSGGVASVEHTTNSMSNGGYITSGSAGGGGNHNHPFTGTKATINTMPPYVAVNIWERTA